MFVDSLIISGLERYLFNHFANEIRNHQTIFQTLARDPGFLPGNLNPELNLFRIVSHDLSADSILERRNDLATGGVVFGIGGKNQHYIERQTHWVALNLNIAFLHDVEKPNLNLACQIRQLVDGKEPPIGPRQEAVMNGQFIAEQVATFRGFDWIHVADDVGDRHVGGREFFYESRVALYPGDRCRVLMQLNRLPAVGADRMKRIVVDLRPGDDRYFRIEQVRQLPNDAAFGLTAQAKQNQVMPGKNRVDKLRHHCLVITNDAGEKSLAAFQLANEICPHFVFGDFVFLVWGTEILTGKQAKYEHKIWSAAAD